MQDTQFSGTTLKVDEHPARISSTFKLVSENCVSYMLQQLGSLHFIFVCSLLRQLILLYLCSVILYAGMFHVCRVSLYLEEEAPPYPKLVDQDC